MFVIIAKTYLAICTEDWSLDLWSRDVDVPRSGAVVLSLCWCMVVSVELDSGAPADHVTKSALK